MASRTLDAVAAPGARRLKPAAGFPTSDGWRLPSRLYRAASHGRLLKSRFPALVRRGPDDGSCARGPRRAAAHLTGAPGSLTGSNG